MKLELKELTPYLPYGLKAEMLDHKIDYVGKQYDEIIGVHQWDKLRLYWSVLTIGGSKPSIERIKPILRPPSDLTKEIEHNGGKFVPIEKINEVDGEYQIRVEDGVMWFCDSCDLEMFEVMRCNALVEKLFEWHFDVFGLIEKGLAIDINTLTLPTCR